MPDRPIADVLRDHAGRLMSLPGVVGVAQGERSGRPCILVLVAAKDSDLLERIPEEIEGHPVRVDETGEFEGLGS